MKATTSLYGNCVVLTGDTPMFRCDQERMNWYLSMGLADIVTKEPPVIRLNFKPKGPGHHGDPYFLQEFKNRCVVCGTPEDLSHHHIVPYCYRKYFPKDSYENGRWFYDVLLLCLVCHDSYEERAQQLKQSIAHEHGVPPWGTTTLNSDEVTIMKAAITLHRHRGKLPYNKREHFEKIVKTYLGKDELLPEDPENVFDVIKGGTITTSAAEIIVSRLKDLDYFAIRWRRHFLRHMQPEFLPELWDAERRIYSEPDNTNKGKS
jgi:hypothetical protein